MMHLMLKIVLVVFITGLRFASPCTSEESEPHDLLCEVEEGKSAVENIRDNLPRPEDEKRLKGLRHLKDHRRSCTKATETTVGTCTVKDKINTCLYGLDVAMDYVPFFVDGLINVSNDTQRLLQNFNQMFENGLGRCIQPINDGDEYNVSCKGTRDCNQASVVLGGLEEWSANVIRIYDSLNNTLKAVIDDDIGDIQKNFKKLCTKESRRRKREQRQKKALKRADRKRRRQEREEKNRKRKENQAEQDAEDDMMTSSPPDCI